MWGRCCLTVTCIRLSLQGWNNAHCLYNQHQQPHALLLVQSHTAQKHRDPVFYVAIQGIDLSLSLSLSHTHTHNFLQMNHIKYKLTWIARLKNLIATSCSFCNEKQLPVAHQVCKGQKPKCARSRHQEKLHTSLKPCFDCTLTWTQEHKPVVDRTASQYEQHSIHTLTPQETQGMTKQDWTSSEWRRNISHFASASWMQINLFTQYLWIYAI